MDRDRLYYKYAHIGCPAAHMEDNCPHPDRCADNGRCVDLGPNPFDRKPEAKAMTELQRRLLLELQQSSLRGAFAVACDGPDRKPAHDLERLGYAEWRGESYGSSFWSVTPNGITVLTAE